MRRRDFLAVSAVVGLSVSISAEEITKERKRLKSVEILIAAVQEHMFPQGSKLPSAKEMRVTEFLTQTITHPSYDRDIRIFVIEGAEELHHHTKEKFLKMTQEQKEKALRTFEETSFGSNWLARIMTLTMEALFADPIYGSNLGEAGWEAVDSFGGQPRPIGRYTKL